MKPAARPLLSIVTGAGLFLAFRSREGTEAGAAPVVSLHREAAWIGVSGTFGP